MFFSNIGVPRVSAIPSFNTIKGLAAFKAPGRFKSTSGGTADAGSENERILELQYVKVMVE